MVDAELNNLPDIIILASAAIFVVTVFLRMNISPVIGYFVAGAAIGLNGLGLVKADELMDSFAEFGVVFLLFLIGLELTFERLAAMRSHVFGFGTLQVIVTMIVITALCYLFGINLNNAIVIGGGLALSSTAIVLQVLEETGKRSTQVGRLSVAILILQDFAVVPLLVLVPLLNSSEGGSETGLMIYIAQALLNASISLIAIFVVGRLVLRPLFKAIAATKSNELFMVVTLLIILSAAYITEHFGLSMALGAFAAGLLVAETEYRKEVENVVLPFKRLLLGLFFMTVGMSIDLKLLLHNLALVTVCAVSLMVLKALIIFALCRAFSFKWASAVNAGLLLSQGGEFAFILFGLEDTTEMFEQHLSQILMMVVTVTMGLTPLAANLGNLIADRFGKRPKEESVGEVYDYDTEDLDQHIILAGFGNVGKVAASVFAGEHINHLVIDINPEIVYNGQNEGSPVYQGDVTKLQLLNSLKASTAKAIVLTMSNEFTLKRTIELVKANFPSLDIILRVRDTSKIQLYKDMGLSYIVSESCETGLQMASHALEIARVKDKEALIRLRASLRKKIYDNGNTENSDAAELSSAGEEEKSKT